MSETSYDFVVIGGGSGGYAAARTAADSGLKTVVIDYAEELGGLCILKGYEPLKLTKAGIETGSSGHILCSAFQETSLPRVFAVGDVYGRHEVVHIAIEQGEKAAENAAILLETKSGERQSRDYRLKLLGIFTDPQVAMVGLTESETKEQGIDVKSASYPFDDHGKSMIMGALHGFVKLIADSSTGQLLGGAVLSPEAVELIHKIVVAMNFKATASEFLKIPHYHPTLSEIWTYPAEDLII